MFKEYGRQLDIYHNNEKYLVRWITYGITGVKVYARKRAFTLFGHEFYGGYFVLKDQDCLTTEMEVKRFLPDKLKKYYKDCFDAHIKFVEAWSSENE